MAYDLYLHLKTNTAKNICDEIKEIVSAQKTENSQTDENKKADSETVNYSEEVKAKFAEISLIAKIIADQKPRSFKPDLYYRNVMHVRFLSKASVDKVRKNFEKISHLVVLLPHAISAPEAAFSGVEREILEVHKKAAFEEPNEPCLGKRKCLGDCKACV